MVHKKSQIYSTCQGAFEACGKISPVSCPTVLLCTQDDSWPLFLPHSKLSISLMEQTEQTSSQSINTFPPCCISH